MPKQIEYWAQIGKTGASSAPGRDLPVLMQLFSRVQVDLLMSAPVYPDEVSTAIEQAWAEVVGTMLPVITGDSFHCDSFQLYNRILHDQVDITG